MTCEECFDQLDRYVEVELQLAHAQADQQVPGMRAISTAAPPATKITRAFSPSWLNSHIRRLRACAYRRRPGPEITVADGTSHIFDSFECAIHAIAPRCEHCGRAIIGHGQEAGGRTYCFAHCARQAGRTELADRSEA